MGFFFTIDIFTMDIVFPGLVGQLENICSTVYNHQDMETT